MTPYNAIPMDSDNYLLHRAPEHLWIYYKIDVTKSSDEVISYSPEIRGCYFKDERYLKHFHIYSENNCLFECIMNLTIKMCGCTAFYMPEVNLVPICGFAKMICIENATISSQFELGHCNCLRSCNEIHYNIVQYFFLQYPYGIS